MVDINDSRLHFVPIPEGIPDARYLCNYYKHYWIYVEDKGILFWQSRSNFAPQSNSDKAVVEYIRDKQYPWAEIKYLENVILPMDMDGRVKIKS